ncbi:MAG: DeoR/GlpR transcriptional regulator [Ruminococcaceae bacterium]|nr:DeoR/GlpR transcriptional regulator [Oscillospiraceae bacterium]
MYKCERQDEILSLLSDTEYATVDYLARKMNISSSSIRRDLKNLEERGLVNRSYGGVKIAEASGKKIPFSLRSHENSPQKKQIAKAATSLINVGDVIFLDGSSSAYFVAELLPSISGVTVITNSVDTMNCLSRYEIKAFCTGGMLSPDNKGVLVGGYAQSFLNHFQADVALFSVQAVNADGRCFDCYHDEIPIRNLMIKNARRKILLCDSSKWNRPSIFYQCCTDDIDYIVSDRDLNELFQNPTPEKYILA